MNIRTILTTFILATLLLILGILIHENKDNTAYLSSEINSIAGECQNKTIFEGANCVNTIVKQIYHYNLSNMGKDLSFYELLTQGTVCSGWANLYCSIGDELGYYTQIVEMTTEEINKTIDDKLREFKIDHVFCIWSNEEGYIILDQRRMFEFNFGEQDSEEIITLLMERNK